MATVKPKVAFEAVPMKIGSGWCVQVTLPYGINPKLGGFTTEEEAREWIARKSAERNRWLRPASRAHHGGYAHRLPWKKVIHMDA